MPITLLITITITCPYQMYGPPPACKWIDASWLQAVCCNVSGP